MRVMFKTTDGEQSGFLINEEYEMKPEDAQRWIEMGAAEVVEPQ